MTNRRDDEKHAGTRPSDGERRLQRLARVPVPVFILAIVLLKLSGPWPSRESPLLLMLLNLLFSMIASYLVALIAGRSFLANGRPWLLTMGSAMVIWGTSSFVSVVGAWHEVNFRISVHNLGVLLSSVFHVAGALLLLRPEWKLRATGVWLPAAFAAALGCASLIAVAAHEGWIPVFFVPGQGGTLLRQAVLGASIMLLALTAGLVRWTARRPSSPFRFWYAWGLVLLAVGLAGIMAQTATGDALGWTSRAAQYLGGIYMIIAAVSAMRESGSWNIPMDEVLSASREQMRLFIEHAPAALAMLDRELRYLIVNRRWMSDYGLGDRNIIGLSHYEVLPEVPERWKEAHRRGLAGEVVREENDRFERADGHTQWLSWEVRPWYTARGRIGGIVIFTEDITSRKEAEQAVREKDQQLRRSYDLLEAVTRGTGVVIAAQDTNLRYTYFNTAYADEIRRLTGKDIAIGMSLADLFAHMPEQQRVAMEEWGKVLRGESSQKTLEFGDAGRHRVFYNILHTPLRDAAGSVIGAGEVASDISDRVQAEKRLAYLASFPELNPNPVLEVDLAGTIRYANPAAQDTLERLGRDRMDARAFLPGDLDDIIAGWDRKGPLTANREITIAGSVFSVLVYFAPELEAARLYAYDITEHKRAEQALQEGESKYRNLFDNMINGFAYHRIILDDEGIPIDYVFLEINRAFERLIGLRAADILGKRVTDALPGIEKDPADWISIYGRVALTGKEVQFEQHSALLNKWFLVSAYAPEKGHFATVFEDITARKLAEDALRKSEALYRAIGESIDYGVWVCAPDGRNIYASESFLKLVGLTQEQCSNFGWGSVLHPDDAERTIAAWKECVRTGGVWDIEHRFRGVDGRYHPVLARGVAVRDEQGAVLYWAGINLDISQLREAEEMLRASEERLLAHIDNSPLAVVEFDRQFRITRWSPEAERMFGWTAAEVIGKAITDLRWIHEEEREAVQRESAGFLMGERSRSTHVNRNYRKNGEVILCEWYSSAIYDAQGSLLSVFSQVLDVTERKKSQDALEQLNEELERRVADRTAELRNLQAHIEAVREGERAHIAREVHDQLGQVMTALKMDVAWLQRNHPSADPAVRERQEEMRELIDGAIHSVKRITSELRPSVLDDFGLQAAVEWAAQEFGKRSGVTCRVRSHPATITMDRMRSTVVYRVLQESLTNIARHSGATNVTVSLELKGERFRMTVEDDGMGIPLEKIEDPFSYGLMGMRERLRHIGGTIDVTGGSGRGTIITASIPLAGAAGPAGEAPSGAPEKGPAAESGNDEKGTGQ